MRGRRSVAALVIGMLAVSLARAETHWQLQAVDAAGCATYPKVGAMPVAQNLVVLEGVVLNNHEDMLDATYDAPGFMGAQWQIFVMGEGADHAGTALWMGQKYSRMGDIDYTPAEWAAEMQRVNYDGNHRIRAGDRVRVTGYALDRNGKVNINERHTTSPVLDFQVEWLASTPGLPAPEVITLAEVKSPLNVDIFDPTRLTGGEYYQGRWVRINDVHLVGGTWWPGQILTVGDDTGRTLPVRLGMRGVFSEPCNLGTSFDVVGIFNQEDAATSGYQLRLQYYDGSDNLLGIVPGDADADGIVSVFDVIDTINAFGSRPGDPNWDSRCDFDHNGIVDVMDVITVVNRFGTGG